MITNTIKKKKKTVKTFQAQLPNFIRKLYMSSKKDNQVQRYISQKLFGMHTNALNYNLIQT